MYGITDSQNYQDIADAIRAKNGSQAVYLPSEMAAAIDAIQVNAAQDPIYEDLSTGYISGGTWVIGGTTVSYSDVYEITNGRQYIISLGSQVGTRFRVMQSTTSPVGASANISGTRVIETNNPAAYAYTLFTASMDGFLTVQKDNAGNDGLKTYLFDLIDLVDSQTR